MAQRRDNGMGTIYQRENGSWAGRIYEGKNAEGKSKYKYFSGKSETEVKRKIREYNRSGVRIDAKRITLTEYLYNWLKTYKRGTIKQGSYDALEKTIKNQIVPNIGHVQLQQLTSDNIQALLIDLKENKGYSHSTVKKVHDCLKAALTHACIKKDIADNPMLLVNMPSKRLFATKQIRYFTQEECAVIVEETAREYKTGKLVYQYADAYVLMLHTGIRLGEAIGLEKTDFNRKAKTLHIQRNVQSVMKRNADGERIGGKQLVCNSTKTYSGDRILPLNQKALEAIERLWAAHPESKYIICDSNGNQIPPERLERTFYRILKNLNIEQAGLHSLRHTFASMLFANKIDIKTISELLGHASIQITLNTYVHLMKKPERKAVASLAKVL